MFIKKILLITIIVCSFSLSLFAEQSILNNPICEVDTLPTTQLINFLQQINVENFYGKPVDSFLLAIPSNLYNLKVYGGSHSRWLSQRASEMVVDFTQDGHGPGAIIYVREYTHMNRYSPTATWNTNLFRQEKIYKIDIYKDQNTCINGSCK
jgi:hypothetical protein